MIGIKPCAARTIQGHLACLRRRGRQACVASLAQCCHRPPDRIGYEENRDWLAYLRTDRQLSGSSLNVAMSPPFSIDPFGLTDVTILRRREAGACPRRSYTCLQAPNLDDLCVRRRLRGKHKTHSRVPPRLRSIPACLP